MSATTIDFQVLHDAYRSRILRYLARLVGEHEAEDLAQDVFVKVSVGLGTFRGESSPSTWIYRIATHVAFDRLRSRPSRQPIAVAPHDPPAGELSADDDQSEMSAAQAAPSVESDAIRLEMNDCIRQFISRLPENYRAVLALSEIEGFKNREIADILGVSLDTAKIRLHRARQELKKKFQAGCEFHRDERNEFACDRKPPAREQYEQMRRDIEIGQGRS